MREREITRDREITKGESTDISRGRNWSTMLMKAEFVQQKDHQMKGIHEEYEGKNKEYV